MKDIATELEIERMLTEDQRDIAVDALKAIAKKLGEVTDRELLATMDIEKIITRMSGAIAVSLFIALNAQERVEEMKKLI